MKKWSLIAMNQSKKDIIPSQKKIRRKILMPKPAIAGLTAAMLEKGTAQKTTAEFEEALGNLGSSLSVNAGDYGTFISGTSLARNLDATIALLQEMLFEPRWDAEEFALLKTKRIQELTQAAGNPNWIASQQYAKLVYPQDHIFSQAGDGSIGALNAVTLDDLKAFHAAHYDLSRAKMRVVGAIDEGYKFNLSGGEPTDAAPITPPVLNPVDAAQIYFYDVPSAKQSVLRIMRPSLKATDKDYPLAEAINFPLGGIYTSKLNSNLRVKKGYTYGIRSGFAGNKHEGSFRVSSSVRTNVTKESIALIRDILASYGPDFTQDELDTMKGALLRGQALKNETNGDKLRMLGDISAYGYAPDYRAQNAKAIEAMTLEDFKALAAKYIQPDAMQYLVVGDAETQAERLKDIGLGDPVMLKKE